MTHIEVAEYVRRKVGRGVFQYSFETTSIVDWSTSNTELYAKSRSVLEDLGYEHVKATFGADNPYTMRHPDGSKVVVGFDRSAGTQVTVFSAE